jgi:D-alanyl-D-alanine endopeptidase (penicillin-binding protein 7)
MKVYDKSRNGTSLVESPCTLKSVCYNAETTCNKLSRKGLSVIRVRFVRVARLICLFAGVFTFALPTVSVAASQKSSGTATTGTTNSPNKKTTAKAPAKKPAKKRVTSSSTARARRARLARARAAAQAKALAEAKEPRFRTDENGVEVPDVRAEAAIIYNPETGEVVWESNSQNQRSIASITKVMTAAVFLEDDPDLSRSVVVQRSDVRGASTTHLRAGYTVTGGDLLHLTLIASDNAAARALARISHGGTEPFIARMNEKARELGLTNTKYVDSSGLLAANVSSAYDMARLISLVSADDRIAGVMRKQGYSLVVGKRTIDVRSTNQLVLDGGDMDVQAGKTGFITKAGYCLATLLRLPEGGPKVAVVVLGAKSNAGRFWETRHLFNWMSSKASELFAGTPVQAPASVN